MRWRDWGMFRKSRVLWGFVKAEEEQTDACDVCDKLTENREMYWKWDGEEEKKKIQGASVKRSWVRKRSLLSSLPCLLPSVFTACVCVWVHGVPKRLSSVACRTTFSPTEKCGCDELTFVGWLTHGMHFLFFCKWSSGLLQTGSRS